MKIPDKLIIDGHRWAVKVSKKITNSQGAVGLCDYEKRRIIVSPEQTDLEIADTIIHEILHAAFPSGIIGPKTEERIISQLAPALLQVLRDNGLWPLK